MKTSLLLSCFILISSFLVSCNNNNSVPDLTDGITGSYTGSMNVTNPSLQNTSYSVTVSQVTNTRVRITPSTGQATTWEAEIMKPATGTITCVLCNSNQVTFTTASNGTVTLSYNFNSNEQFSGTKP